MSLSASWQVVISAAMLCDLRERKINRTHSPLFERQDRLKREADERVGIEAEQNYPSNSAGQHEGEGR